MKKLYIYLKTMKKNCFKKPTMKIRKLYFFSGKAKKFVKKLITNTSVGKKSLKKFLYS